MKIKHKFKNLIGKEEERKHNFSPLLRKKTLVEFNY